MKLIIYTEPLNANCTLRLDQGISFVASPDKDANGRDCQSFNFDPNGINNGWGAQLTITAPGKVTISQRGIFWTTSSLNAPNAMLAQDDFKMQDEKICPEPIPPQPEPHPDTSPWNIIQAVYNNGDFDLGTKEGCGQFAEACCEKLHILNSDDWGHIRKSGAQNQYNGHAVDAIMLLHDAGETKAGGYDLVVDSESPRAKPAFNYAGIAVPSLWYYPA